MKVGRVFKIIGRLILGSFVLGFLFLFFTVGQLFVPGLYQLMHPMHTAVRHNWYPVVYVLSYAGFKNAKAYGIKGECTTALQLAIRAGSIKSVGILLDREASTKGCGRYQSLFNASSMPNNILAASVRHPDLLEYLLTERKIDPLYRDDPKGVYPVFSSIGCNKGKLEDSTQSLAKSLEIFLQHGVDPNIVKVVSDSEQEKGVPLPLLASAALSGCPLPVKILLEHGADPMAAHLALREHYKKKGVHKGSAYEFQFDNKLSEEVKDTLRTVKRAAGIEASLPLAPTDDPAQFTLNVNNIRSWKEVDQGISVRLTSSAQENLLKLTQVNLKKPLALYINTIWVGSPIVHEAITRDLFIVLDSGMKEKVLPFLPADKREKQK